MSRQRRRRPPNVHGVIIVDKPIGMTSHDVVARVRRHFKQRRVGHAGTLDPAATGVLVVMLGEATKLAPFLTAHDKRYHAGVQLGWSTDSHDAEGAETERTPLPDWLENAAEAQQRIEAALAEERLRSEQLPPVFSAIKVGGKAAHRLAREGNAPELPPRPVKVLALTQAGLSPDGIIQLQMAVAKGYYVRSLARDLGGRLGVPAHLCALRRVASGPYSIQESVPLDGDLSAALLTPAKAAARAMPLATLTTDGCVWARQGRSLEERHFTGEAPKELSAWLDDTGVMVAVGDYEEGTFRVKRGFTAMTPPANGTEHT